MKLAAALGIAFDELVSLQVADELSELKIAFDSPLLRELWDGRVRRQGCSGFILERGSAQERKKEMLRELVADQR